jgi:hypothetical protein
MNSPWKTNQEKYILKQISSLLREIKLFIICYEINTLLWVERRCPPHLWSRDWDKKLNIFEENFVAFIA